MKQSSINLKVAAVVVTYNRLNLLKECIESLRSQSRKLDEIIVINNSSSDGTIDWLDQQKDLLVISQENSGSSGGQYTGIKIAYERGCDWIWCMDDDAEPLTDSLNNLLIFDCSNVVVSAIAGAVINRKGENIIQHRGNVVFNKFNPFYLHTPLPESYYFSNNNIQINFASFVGILINRKAVEKVGLPKKDLFVQHDDSEYCMRLKDAGEMFFVPKSKIIHKEKSKSEQSIGKRFILKYSYRIPFELEWTIYYGRRNYVWLCRKYIKNMYYCYGSIGLTFLIYLRRIFLYDDNKIKRIKMLYMAFNDGIKGIFDNDKPKKINARYM
jgi:rhamnopyranosyl-N-acetylglucosaminyl-diphospho-decaprenol beta-1,3/1,4-galactofuranosyltransferase